MSLHVTCRECDKHLGGVALVDGLTKEEIKEAYDMFFRQPKCKNKSCPHKDGL